MVSDPIPALSKYSIGRCVGCQKNDLFENSQHIEHWMDENEINFVTAERRDRGIL